MGCRSEIQQKIKSGPARYSSYSSTHLMLTLFGELRQPSLASTVPYFLVTFQVSLLTKMLCIFCFISLLAPYMVHKTFLSVFINYAVN